MAENQIPDPHFDVFLSYNSSDRKAVIEIGEALKQQGLKVWLDVWELVPGRPWQDALESIIQTARSAAVFVGPSGLGPWQEPEMRALLTQFVKRESSVIPVLLPGIKHAPDLPLFLQAFTWVDIRGGVNKTGIGSLIWGITGIKPEVAPNPKYRSLSEKELGEKLHRLLIQKSELANAKADLSEINSRILKLKRKQRDGPNLNPGEFLGDNRFRLLGIIGDGGFSTVWKAFDMSFERMVALKVLHGQYARGTIKKQRFFRGAKQMAKFSHPNIVEVFEPKGEYRGFFYFAMEYVEGTDLQRLVQEKGALAVEEMVRIVSLVGNGLSHAHQRDVIHRDVKPSNILVDLAGRVKLTDFDLVKAADTTGGTRLGGLGTYGYAAPELGTDASSADHRSDIYGLAMTAIFALLGQDLSPFIHDGVGNSVKSLQCQDSVRQVLARGIAREAAHRYPTVAAFCEALGAALNEPRKEASVPKPIPAKPHPLAGQREMQKVLTPEEKDYWVRVEPGTFQMGDDPRNHDGHELDNLVKITQGYWMGCVPVTNSVFKKFIIADGYKNQRWWDQEGWDWLQLKGEEFDRWYLNLKTVFRKKPLFSKEFYCPSTKPMYWDEPKFRGANHPVVGINRYEANAFCNWLSDHLSNLIEESFGKNLRVSLPTEVQWEYAAQGKAGREFPWGNGEPNRYRANYQEFYNGTTRVGNLFLGATPDGCFDLAGNVWEWCLDFWAPNLKLSFGNTSDDLPISFFKHAHVVRGGSWLTGAETLKCSHRTWSNSFRRSKTLGFRVILSSWP